jgi:Mg-chelatase subunit ChlD
MEEFMKYNKKTMQGIYKRVVGAMSGLKDIEIKIDTNVCPCFDIQTNTILMPETMPFAENDEEDFQFSRGTLVHESSHVLFAPNISAKYDRYESEGVCPKDFAEWFNVFADLNNEYKVAMVFPTLKKPLADKTEALFKKKPKQLKSDNPFMQVLMRCDKLANIKPEYPEGYNKVLIDFIEDTVKKFNMRKIQSCKGKELCIFTDEVFRDWTDLCNQHKHGSSELQKLLDKLNKQLGQAIKSKDSKMIEKLEKMIKEKSPDGSSWFQDNNEISREVKSPSNNFSESDLKDLIEQVKAKEAEKQKEENEAMSSIFSRSPGNMTQTRPDGLSRDNYNKPEAIKQGRVINRRLKNQVKLQEDFESKHRSGNSIDLQEVTRQIAQAGRIYKTNVFQRKNNFTRGGEWAIEVMVDCSGSMGGKNMRDAKQALATLAYALNGLPNVHYALTGFEETSGYNEYQVKLFHERSLKTRYLDSLGARGGTPIETAVQMSMKRLVKFKNIRKIMVVITDGCGDVTSTTQNVKIAERFKIKVIGIGIGSDKIKESFGNHYLYKDTSNLDADLTRLILENLHERKTAKLVKRAWEN